MTSFDAVIAGGGNGSALYAGPDGVEQLNGALLSETRSRCGHRGAIGRTLTPDDGKPGSPPVFVMSYKLWANRFGPRPFAHRQELHARPHPDDIGRRDAAARVSKLGADVWRPVVLDRATASWRASSSNSRTAEARRHDRTGRREFQTVAARVSKLYPRNYPEHFSAHVLQCGQHRRRAGRRFYTMAARSRQLPLIACANVANMLLSRAAGGSASWR